MNTPTPTPTPEAILQLAAKHKVGYTTDEHEGQLFANRSVDDNMEEEILAFTRDLLAGSPTAAPELDVAGNPKLELTVLESVGLHALNRIKAWHDSDTHEPFPGEVFEYVDAFLMMAATRRKGVQ